MLGDKIARYRAEPRSVIGAVETSHAGNVLLRVGRENDDGQGWHQTEHVALTPDEAHGLIEQLYGALAARSEEAPRV